MKGKLHILSIAVLIFCIPQAHAQMVTTIAGSGLSGFSGDGGPATAAQFDGVAGIKRDNAGNLYFADDGNNRIRKINSVGIITTIAGCCGITYFGGGYNGDGGPATNAQMLEPTDVAFDGMGNLYIADGANNVIRKVDAAGIISTVAGVGYPGFSGDNGPATLAQLDAARTIAVDSAGNIFMGDFNNHRIRKVNTFGVITTIAGTGVAGYEGDGGPATAAKMDHPGGIVVDSLGNLYFADGSYDVIRKIDAAGIITTVAGTGTFGTGAEGIPATASALFTPAYLAMDGMGNLFFTDYGNHRVRKIDSAGIINTVVGDGIQGYGGDDSCSALYARFNRPYGMAVDGYGNLYISDLNNARIRKTIPDHAPAFTGGHSITANACKNVSNSMDALLAVTDIDAGQMETWSVLQPASHGAAAVGYAASSTGGLVTPSGLSYTPIAGYTGYDTFAVTINDCVSHWDTTTVYLTVNNCALSLPVPGVAALQVSPNPGPGTFTVTVSSAASGSMRVQVTDIVGHLVKEVTTTTNSSTEITLDAPAGVYFLSATTPVGCLKEKIVIAR